MSQDLNVTLQPDGSASVTVQNEGSGTVIATPQAALTSSPELQASPTLTTVTRGPKGDPGVSGTGVQYNFPTPQLIWLINHNLGRYPSVTVVDSAGATIIGDVEYPDANNIVITFSAAFGGTAYVV